MTQPGNRELPESQCAVGKKPRHNMGWGMRQGGLMLAHFGFAQEKKSHKREETPIFLLIVDKDLRSLLGRNLPSFPFPILNFPVHGPRRTFPQFFFFKLRENQLCNQRLLV